MLQNTRAQEIMSQPPKRLTMHEYVYSNTPCCTNLKM